MSEISLARIVMEQRELLTVAHALVLRSLNCIPYSQAKPSTEWLESYEKSKDVRKDITP